MGPLLHVLTVIFVVAKLLQLVTWSWWLVFLPSIVALALMVFFVIVALVLAYITAGR